MWSITGNDRDGYISHFIILQLKADHYKLLLHISFTTCTRNYTVTIYLFK